MTEICSLGIVSYYNHLTMYRQQQQAQTSIHQQHLTSQQQQQAAVTAAAVVAGAAAVAAAEGSQQYWYPHGYPHGHPSSGSSHQSSPGSQHQYLDHLSSPTPDVLGCSWAHSHPYSHHLSYQQPLYHHQNQQSPMTPTPTDWSMSKTNNNNNNNNNNNIIVNSEPSPPITISGSEISSPGTPASPNISSLNAANNNNNNNSNNNNSSSASTTPVRPAPIRSPYEWMKKTSYIHQQNPGKTRTKDKYRVVYTDHQRLELEKEFHYSRYITIRRKAELASHLALSERQVKIWFQNRRAKERKQVKKREELEQKDVKPNIHQESLQTPGGMVSLSALSGMSGMLSGLMHNGNSPPLNLGPTPHSLGLTHSSSSLHSHVHPHSVLGL